MDKYEDLLWVISDSTEYKIKLIAARVKILPPKVLKKLSKDKDGKIKCEIAKRSDLTESIINKLGRDEDVYVQMNIAQNPKVTPEILDELSRHEIDEIRIAVAHNPNTSVKILIELYKKNLTNRGMKNEITKNLLNKDLSEEESEAIHNLLEEQFERKFEHKGEYYEELDGYIQRIQHCNKGANDDTKTILKELSDCIYNNGSILDVNKDLLEKLYGEYVHNVGASAATYTTLLVDALDYLYTLTCIHQYTMNTNDTQIKKLTRQQIGNSWNLTTHDAAFEEISESLEAHLDDLEE